MQQRKGPKDPRRRVSDAQEKRVAKTLGAKPHAGSGSGSRPHDMHTATELIECKTVLAGNKQITIKDDYMDRFVFTALSADKEPVLHVELGKHRLVLISEAYYSDLRDDG
jgi:hypothetical protein